MKLFEIKNDVVTINIDTNFLKKCNNTYMHSMHLYNNCHFLKRLESLLIEIIDM